MSKTMKLQAREIVRFAKRTGIEMRRGWPSRCAKGVAKNMYGLKSYATDQYLVNATGLKLVDIAALEMGFENWPTHIMYYDGVSQKQLNNIHKNRYYKVGKRVAELAGLA
jgi:hypothetical protein